MWFFEKQQPLSIDYNDEQPLRLEQFGEENLAFANTDRLPRKYQPKIIIVSSVENFSKNLPRRN